jgi:hypothetical protein
MDGMQPRPASFNCQRACYSTIHISVQEPPVPNAAAVDSAQLEPMVRDSPLGAASALVGGGIMVGGGSTPASRSRTRICPRAPHSERGCGTGQCRQIEVHGPAAQTSRRDEAHGDGRQPHARPLPFHLVGANVPGSMAAATRFANAGVSEAEIEATMGRREADVAHPHDAMMLRSLLAAPSTIRSLR